MTALGLALGLLFALGVIAFVYGAVPREESITFDTPRPESLQKRLGLAGPEGLKKLRNLGIGVGLGLLAALVTRAPIWLLIMPIGAVVLPPLLKAGDGGRMVERSEALETWTRSMSGILITGVGLEEAIRGSLSSTPAAIKAEMGRLVARLEAGQPIEAALRVWADEMDDPTADLVAGALIMGSRTRKGGLSRALAELADVVGDQTRMVQAIEAERAGPRTTVRWVTVISLIVVGAVVLNPGWGAAYRTPMGQLILVGIAASYLGVLRWMQSIARGKPRTRFLVEGEFGKKAAAREKAEA